MEQTRSSNCGVELREGVHVRVIGVCFQDLEGVGIDFVHAEARVDIGERGDAGTNPAGSEGMCGVLHRAVEGVVDHEFIFVGVTEENIRNDVWRVASDNLVEVVGRIGDRVGPIPAREDMAKDPDALALVFSVL